MAHFPEALRTWPVAWLPVDVLDTVGAAVVEVVVEVAVEAVAAVAAALLLHRSLISRSPRSRALTNTAEDVSVLSRKLDTQNTT